MSCTRALRVLCSQRRPHPSSSRPLPWGKRRSSVCSTGAAWILSRGRDLALSCPHGDSPECHPDSSPSSLPTDPTVPCRAPAPDAEGTQNLQQRGSNPQPLARTLALFQPLQHPPRSSSHCPSTGASQGSSRLAEIHLCRDAGSQNLCPAKVSTCFFVCFFPFPMNKMHRLHLHCSRARPYGAGKKRLSRARRSRGERSWWWPPCRDPPLAVAPREAKIFRLRRGCGGRKLLIIFRSMDPSSGKWRVLTNAFSCTGREGGWAAALPGIPSPCPLPAPLILPLCQGHRTHGMAPQQWVFSHHPHCSPEARPTGRHRGRSLQGSGLEF